MVDIWSSIIGGIVGGILGVIGTISSSYWGPRKFEEWKDKRIEEKELEPRKKLLKQMLEDESFRDGRKIQTLCMVTGTQVEKCRDLLIEIGARGVNLEGDIEGWALISRKPLNEV